MVETPPHSGEKAHVKNQQLRTFDLFFFFFGAFLITCHIPPTPNPGLNVNSF